MQADHSVDMKRHFFVFFIGNLDAFESDVKWQRYASEREYKQTIVNLYKCYSKTQIQLLNAQYGVVHNYTKWFDHR